MIAESINFSFIPFLLCTDLNTNSAAPKKDNLKACHEACKEFPLLCS